MKGHESHDHAHVDLRSGNAGLRARQKRVLLLVLILNAAFLGVEVAGGVIFGSLALLADAAHMLGDVAGLIVAVVAHTLSTRPADDRHTFGLQRTEVLGAQVNGLILLVSAVWIIAEAIRRIGDPPEIDGTGLLVVATIGLAVNVGSAIALLRVREGSLNVHGAYVHMMMDAAGSVGAMLAGLAVVLVDATWVDTAMSLGIAVLVIVSGWRLLRAATHVILEGTPERLSPDEVADAIGEMPGVQEVHHLHMWSLASDSAHLSAHVVVEGDIELHEAQERGDRVRDMLAERFGIGHATLELECHPCVGQEQMGQEQMGQEQVGQE